MSVALHDKRHHTISALGIFISLLSALIITYLGIVALLYTVILPINYLEKPAVSIKYSIAGTICSFAITAFVYYTISHIKTNKTPSINALYKIQTVTVLSIGLVWLSIATTSPVADQGISITLSNWLQSNDLQNLQENNYLQQYPFQSGYILFCTAMGKLFGMNNMLPIRFFNLLMIAISLKSLCRITEKIFNNDNITKATILISTAFFPFTLFTTFVYGNIPSIAFCLLACLLQQIVLQTLDNPKKSITYGTLSAVCLFIALWFKPNSLIFLIGIEVIWAIALITYKRAIVVVFIALSLIAYVASSAIPVSIMESRMGIPLDHPTPKTAWIAMGLQESPKRAPGWYNNYVIDVYNKAQQDSDKTDELAKEEIIRRLTTFAHNPSYTADFFTRKITSTWAEPTFQSLWISYGGTGGERSDLTHSILERSIMQGKLHSIYIVYCDVLQTIIYMGAACCFIVRWKKLSIQQIGLALVFLGGFTFHLFWETKSDYVLPYFILLIPYAAAGWHDFIFSKHNPIHTLQRHATPVYSDGK